ncbi:MAG TPA: hypothetical protein VKT78_20365 [Fimbriimonadaceae bacterium]|nr:hypothetical protein [Fimbriimonadaceae bacterium]
MNSRLDQDLLDFALGELGMRKRLDVRMRLLLSGTARERLSQLDRAAGVVAGAIGTGGAPAFRANTRLKLRRLLLVDLMILVLLLLALGAGAFVVWRNNHPPVMPSPCSVQAVYPDGSPQPKHHTHYQAQRSL